MNKPTSAKPKKMSPLKLVDKSNDSKHVSPEYILNKTLGEYKDGSITGKKLLILCLDDEDENHTFDIYRRMAGMSAKEAVFVMESVKTDIINNFLS